MLQTRSSIIQEKKSVEHTESIPKDDRFLILKYIACMNRKGQKFNVESLMPRYACLLVRLSFSLNNTLDSCKKNLIPFWNLSHLMFPPFLLDCSYFQTYIYTRLYAYFTSKWKWKSILFYSTPCLMPLYFQNSCVCVFTASFSTLVVMMVFTLASFS